jgi:hypothetical protein
MDDMDIVDELKSEITSIPIPPSQSSSSSSSPPLLTSISPPVKSNKRLTLKIKPKKDI